MLIYQKIQENMAENKNHPEINSVCLVAYIVNHIIMRR